MGFEIVGIGFDESRDALTQFLKAKEIPWPEFCDGKGWANEFGRLHGIGSIPTVWLVDRMGILRELNARGAPEQKVAKLMDESP